jgi:hypothetical protein
VPHNEKTIFLMCIGPQLLAFYRKMLNLRLLFKNQSKLKLSFVFKWLDISELKMPKLVDLCVLMTASPVETIFHASRNPAIWEL